MTSTAFPISATLIMPGWKGSGSANRLRIKALSLDKKTQKETDKLTVDLFQVVVRN